jgi:serine/threonine protein kinase
MNKKLGPYQLTQELGRGSYTIVYKAWQDSLKRFVTLKVLRNKDDPRALEKLRYEAQLSAGFSTPGVRRIYEVVEPPGECGYVVMEYVEQSLKDLIVKRRKQKKVFSRQEVGYLLTPIAGALDDIHRRGLVHLDIKPRNILVSEGGHAVLADFGIARRRDEQTQEGTPLYMSPEQAAGNRPVGPWSDIYSLGVLIYEMVAGQPPFVGEQDVVLIHQHLQSAPPAPRKFNPRLDRDLERTLLAALNKDPRQRPPSASALLQAVSQRRSTPVIDIVDSASSVLRRRPYLALIPLALIMLIVLLPLAFGREPETTPPPPSPTRPTHPPTHTFTPAPPYPTLVTPEPSVTIETDTPVAPSSTPRPSSTKSPTRVRPSPTLGAASIDLWEPVDGAEVQGDRAVGFRWAGQLSGGQSFVVHLRHAQGNRSSPELTTTTWSTSLPVEWFGEWHWHVEITPGGASSAEKFFWYQPYPTSYPTLVP